MNTEFTNELNDGIYVVGASNGEEDYILWQQSENEPDQIHFEFNSQINSGYNILRECLIDNDGCHIVLNDGQLVHFYWHPPRHPKLEKFVEGLKKIYAGSDVKIDDSI